MYRVTLAGLKQKDSLALASAAGGGAQGPASLTRALARETINLVFFSVAGGARPKLHLCVEASAAVRTLALARAEGFADCRLIEPVSILTLYPLERSLRLPAAVSAALAAEGVAPLAMGASSAALAVLVPGARADAARRTLARELNLPPGASPARAEVRVVQSARRRED